MKTKVKVFIITMILTLSLPLALVFGTDAIHENKVTALTYLYLYECTAFLIIVFSLVMAFEIRDMFKK